MLQTAFGVSNLFPSTLVLVPPGGNVSDPAWLQASCAALEQAAATVSAKLRDEGCSSDGSTCDMTPADFTGAMLQNGVCVTELLDDICVKYPAYCDLQSKIQDELVSMHAPGESEPERMPPKASSMFDQSALARMAGTRTARTPRPRSRSRASSTPSRRRGRHSIA